MQRSIDIGERAALIEFTVRAREVAFEKSFVVALHEHIETKLATVEREQRVIRLWRGYSGGSEQLAGKFLIQARDVLKRVVQGKFGQPVKSLPGCVLVEVEGEG